MIGHEVDRLSLQHLEYEMERFDLTDDNHFSETGYCGHPDSPYTLTQQDQSTEWIISHFQEEDHPFIYNTLGNKKTQLVCLYSAYILKKNASRTDTTDDDQKAYAFETTYGDTSTDFQLHMISVVVFSS